MSGFFRSVAFNSISNLKQSIGLHFDEARSKAGRASRDQNQQGDRKGCTNDHIN